MWSLFFTSNGQQVWSKHYYVHWGEPGTGKATWSRLFVQGPCKSVFGSNIGWEATCWEAIWLGSHWASWLGSHLCAGKHFGWEAILLGGHLLGSTYLAGKPFCWGCCLGWEATLSGKTEGGGGLLIRQSPCPLMRCLTVWARPSLMHGMKVYFF